MQVSEGYQGPDVAPSEQAAVDEAFALFWCSVPSGVPAGMELEVGLEAVLGLPVTIGTVPGYGQFVRVHAPDGIRRYRPSSLGPQNYVLQSPNAAQSAG